MVEDISWNLIDGATFTMPERPWEGFVGESKVHDASEAAERREIWMGDDPRMDIPRDTFECQAIPSFSTLVSHSKGPN